MTKLKENKGITLIALIITIIIMLILVGVTINVVINENIFTMAKYGVNKTEIEADREILQQAIIEAFMNQKEIKIKTLQSILDNLPTGWTGEGEGPYTFTSPNGNKFIVDADGNITVVSEVSDEQQEEVILADWWKLTDEEMKTLKDNNKYSENDDTYFIAEVTNAVQVNSITSFDIANMMENNMIYITINMEDMGYIGYIYIGDETIANAFSFNANKWYYLSNGSDPSTATEYTGAFPLKGQGLTTGVYCESYVNRIKASFKDNGSSEGTEQPPEETVTNWWEQTTTESTIISKKSGLVAEKSTVSNYNIQANEHAVVIMQSEKSMYFFILKDEDANTYSQISGKTIEKYKWYYTSDMTTLSDVSLCTGQCPVEKSDFDQIYCESYLNRVIENFNK